MANWSDTQNIALELIGAKVGAANSLEGRLSGDDDLSSMADEGDNIQLALAKAILRGDSATGDIAMTSIKNFGNDRDYDAFEKYYMSLLEKHKEDNKQITTLFEETTPEMREMKMFETMAKELIEQHNEETLYGKVWSFKDDKGKKQFSTQYKGHAHCFEICEDYKANKFQGLSFSAKRGNSYKELKGIEIYRVQYEETAPYVPVENSSVFMPIDVFKHFLDKTQQDVKELAKSIQEFVNKEKVATQSITNVEFSSLFDFDVTQTQETKIESIAIESITPVYYYKGKGKNKIKVEISNPANLFDYIPDDIGSGGIQLSLF